MSEIKIPENTPKTNSVLITGGSGLVGRYLTSALLNKGYKVSHLSRKANLFGKVRVFRWDPENGILDPSVFEGIDYVVHLAGANIGEKKWTKKRKEEIIKSRIDSSRLLFKVISNQRITIKAFISASAVGYYGSLCSDRIFNEDDQPATDFLGTTCRLWEESADMFSAIGIRTVKIRSAVVLEKTDSALSKLIKPAKYGFLVQAGDGQQYMPWIHIEDLCGIYLRALMDENIIGPYNAVSPQHITHKDFVTTLATVMNKSVFRLPVPGLIFRAVLGEMSDVILKGSRVSSQKITKSGYHFVFRNLQEALENILGIN
jgi:uncharacterized protein (TIGR01777 family)